MFGLGAEHRVGREHLFVVGDERGRQRLGVDAPHVLRRGPQRLGQGVEVLAGVEEPHQQRPPVLRHRRFLLDLALGQLVGEVVHAARRASCAHSAQHRADHGFQPLGRHRVGFAGGGVEEAEGPEADAERSGRRCLPRGRRRRARADRMARRPVSRWRCRPPRRIIARVRSRRLVIGFSPVAIDRRSVNDVRRSLSKPYVPRSSIGCRAPLLRPAPFS